LRTLENYKKENITHIEARALLGSMFDSNGPLSLEDEINTYKEIFTEFKQTTPESSVKIIM